MQKYDGNYTDVQPVSVGEVSKLPDLNAFLSAARKANPGISDEKLTNFYNKKYGTK